VSAVFAEVKAITAVGGAKKDEGQDVLLSGEPPDKTLAGLHLDPMRKSLDTVEKLRIRRISGRLIPLIA
jgi:hypothetical protein